MSTSHSRDMETTLQRTAAILERLLSPPPSVTAQIQRGLKKYGTRGFFQRLDELDLPEETRYKLHAVRLVLYGTGELKDESDQENRDVPQDWGYPYDTIL
ncbi:MULTISPECIES: hypothetical protein [Paenibacillaceae]|uniref:hypothetical protein n=1 Tax=Paenibacillaceae TaxID=186822 RepID=UPI0018CC3A16|nr:MULTISPECIES: hypothetical protein [Paenibacillaceae]GIP20863.1 hypothetical protein J22TS3_11380 [Paenibacillus sp. J22TS3]